MYLIQLIDLTAAAVDHVVDTRLVNDRSPLARDFCLHIP